MAYGLTCLNGFIVLALMVWFVFFSVLVISKLDRIIELLTKKQ